MKEDSDKLEVVKVNTIYAEESLDKSSVSITAWINGSGYDIAVISKNGGIQSILLTCWEFDLIKKMVKKLDKTPAS